MTSPTTSATTSPAAGRSARERARAEITAEIVESAKRQMAREGAAALSLRAVARDLGMVSSAVYRYFPSRDSLLTRLIIDSYDAVGDAADAADAAQPRTAYAARYLAVATAVRRWALEHPHEWVLIYGSPVPGYVAPPDTIAPGTRVSVTLSQILLDALAHGHVPAPDLPVPAVVSTALAALHDFLGEPIPDAWLIRGLMARTQMFGHIGLEVDGQFANTITDLDAYYEHVMTLVTHDLGLE